MRVRRWCLLPTAREVWGLHAGLAYAYTRHEYAGVSSRNRDLHRLAIPLTVDVQARAGTHAITLAPVVATSSNVFKDFPSQGRRDDWQWQPATTMVLSAELGALLHRQHRFVDDAGFAQQRDAGNAGFFRLTLQRPF